MRRLKDESMRERLIDACRSLREFLKITLTPKMNCPEGVELYQERWQRLDAVLAGFQQNPANFDSRAGLGLAERIHRVEPTNMLKRAGKSFFALRPDKHKKGACGPHDLARILGEAYRFKGFGDVPAADLHAVWGEYYGQAEPDLICSELANFFDGLSKDLRRHEQDQALAVKRKSPEDVEIYQQQSLDRISVESPHMGKLFALRVCSKCFRLIPEREGETKTTIGKTCALHDPTDFPPAYRTAHNRLKTTQASLEAQRRNKNLDIESNFKNPEWVPLRLRTLMKTCLLDIDKAEISSPNKLSDLAYRIFSTPENDLVDRDELIIFLEKVEDSYPDIVKPTDFTAKIRKLMENNGHTPKGLLVHFASFLRDVYLPHHPKIVALYMQFFLEESWFAQEFAPDYYPSNRGKGRPPKIDPDLVINAYEDLIIADPSMKREAAKILSERFQCSPTRVRQILGGPSGPKKR